MYVFSQLDLRYLFCNLLYNKLQNKNRKSKLEQHTSSYSTSNQWPDGLFTNTRTIVKDRGNFYQWPMIEHLN